jgi:protein ImuA
MSAALDSLAPAIAHLRTIATPVTDYRVLRFGVEVLVKLLKAS